jgi:DNA repair photolyase
MSSTSASLQAILPIFELTPPVGRPDPAAEAVRERAGVEYFELPSRTLLNRCTTPRMPFDWTINPYRGCEFACTYCYARYTHSFFDFENWEDFERKIFVKRGPGSSNAGAQNAVRSLQRKLRSSDLHGQPIAIGTATDPYQPAERHYGVTRSILEAFREAEGLDISITTKSPLILRDLDLLVELDRRHAISVHVTLTTVDSALARRIEQHAPEPRARLKTLRGLAAEGIDTRVNCMPLMPGINNGETQLRPLLEACREAGATDVHASPLFLRPAARARFMPWLAEEFPRLEERYRRLYGRRDHLRPQDKDRLMAPFRRLRLEYGFPRAQPGRG